MQSMQVDFCGVRGSLPAAGVEFSRDGGTGLQRAAALLEGDAFSGSIVLSHLHWDHVQGLPFFSAGDRADSHVELLLPEQSSGASALDVLAGLMSPPYFPIGPKTLRGEWSFQSIAT